jgi:hypothetical protein
VKGTIGKTFSGKRSWPALGVVLFWLFIVPSAHAIIRLVPPIQEIQVQRGSQGTFLLTIMNDSDEDVPSTFSVHDLDITVEGRPFISETHLDRGCGPWIELETTECIVPAHDSFVLRGKISVPPKAEGGYYALIKGTFVGTTIPISGEKVDIEGSALRLENQAMVALLLTVPSSRNKPELVPDTLLVFPGGRGSSSGIDAAMLSKDAWVVEMPLRNKGNIHTRVTGTVTLWSESGVKVGSAPLLSGQGYLLPGKMRNFRALGESPLPDGYYMMRVALKTTEYFTMTQSFPFAIYKGEVFPGAVTEELARLIRSSAPGFTLKKPFIEKKITPGGSTYLPIQLVNTGNDTLRLFPQKMDWDLDRRGQPTLYAGASDSKRSCRSWIEFVEDELKLPPGRTASFKLKIRSPQDISGSYYAAIVFHPEISTASLPAEFMALRTQLIAVTTVQNCHYQVKLDTIRVKKAYVSDQTVHRFLFQVQNVGNVHCFAAGNMSLEREAAKGVYQQVGRTQEFGDTQTFLLPGNRRSFEIPVPDLESGRYRIIVALNYKESTQPIVEYRTVMIH